MEIKMTIIHHQGKTLPLGRNAAVKLLLEKSKTRKIFTPNRLTNVARNLWMRGFPRQAA